MELFRRFAVTALGVVTLSAAVGLPQQPGARPTPRNGQTTPAVTWHFDSLPVGQPPAGFSFGRTGGGRVGPWIVQSASDAPSPSDGLGHVHTDRPDYRFPVPPALSPTFPDCRGPATGKPA